MIWSVKEQMLVGLSQDTPEYYQNVKVALNLIQVQEKCQIDSLVISCDLKLALLCGIQSHSSKHPCCWFNVSSLNLQNCGHPPMFGDKGRQLSGFMSSS